MSSPREVAHHDRPGVRRLHLAALYLTIIALLLCLQFIWHTSGGTLFLFSTFAPILVATATAMVVGVAIAEYRHSHRLFEIERHSAGSVIFRQGEAGESAYFIRSGQVEVVNEETGRVFATLGEGEHFGEMALITNAPRNATVRATAELELAVLGKRNFLNMMKLMPATEEAILSTVRERAMESHEATAR